MIIPFIATDLREINPSVLAYIGDSVYELYSRCHVSERTAANSGKMHKLNVKYVSASSQAKAAMMLTDELTEIEHEYFLRGRNSNSPTMSKNASPMDYMNATGFEALLGYLFLDNQGDRLDYIIQKAFEVIDGE
ncbi:MAG: Mini-ribonuclease 3 [Clostridiales bacterium]|nr:Mini-ribonuclease 3 [Clostridiales bacterium]